MNKKTLYKLAALSLAMATVLTGCKKNEEPEPPANEQTQEEIIISGNGNNSDELAGLNVVATAADGTPIIDGEYDIFDCIKFDGLKKLRVKYSLNDYASDNAVVIYAKLNKEAHAIVDNPNTEIIWGDKVDIDIVSVIDGKETDDFNYNSYLALIGGGVLDSRIEKELIGKKAGESFTVDCNYEADYPYEAYAGKTVTYKIKVNQIARPEAPTEKELEEARTILMVSEAEDKMEAIYTAAKRAIGEKAKCVAYPKTMLDGKKKTYEQRYVDVYGSVEKYLEKTGITAEEHEDAKNAYAINAVKEDLLLIALKEKTGINENSKSYKDAVNESTSEMQESEILYRLILDEILKDAIVTKE